MFESLSNGAYLSPGSSIALVSMVFYLLSRAPASASGRVGAASFPSSMA